MRALDDQTFADCVSHEARARAARRDGKTCISRSANDEACLLRAFRKCDADRFDLINRRVRLSKRASQPVCLIFLSWAEVILSFRAKRRNLAFKEIIRDVSLRST